MKRSLWLTLAFLAFAGLPFAADADEGDKSGFLTSRVRGTLSLYRPNLDSTLRVDPDAGPSGTKLELERDLRLDDSDTLPRLDLVIRLTPHHRIDLSYFRLDRSGSNMVGREVVFGDQTYDASATLGADLQTDIAQISYSWSFINDGRIELGVAVGAYIARLESSLGVRTGGGREQVQAADTTAGLPLLGVYGAYAINPRLALSAQGQWLSFNVNDYDVTLTQAGVGLDWQVVEHIGLNASYRYYKFYVERDSGGFSGDFELEFAGPSVGVSVYF